MNCLDCSKEVVADRLFCTWCETFMPNPSSGEKAGLFGRWVANAIDPVIAIVLYVIAIFLFSGVAGGAGVLLEKARPWEVSF